MDWLAILATLACALFAGAALYIHLVEHPARLSCGTELAAREFAPSCKRATVMQVSLALFGTFGGVAQWFQGRGSLWLGAASSIFAVVPFTLIVILPTNRKLLEPGRDLGSDDLGFTPATNFIPLRRLALDPGRAAEAPAAWLEASAGRLELLPRRYERRSEATNWYEAPSVDDAALLEVAPSGFVHRYPGLSEAEAASGADT